MGSDSCARASMTNKMKAFVDEYLMDLNATQAAIRAGYSKRRANVTGTELLSHPDVQEALTGAFKARGERVQVKEADVINGLLREVNSGDLDEPSHARVKAWELLGRYMGMFREAEVPPAPAVVLPDPLTPEEWQVKHGDNEQDPNLH